MKLAVVLSLILLVSGCAAPVPPSTVAGAPISIRAVPDNPVVPDQGLPSRVVTTCSSLGPPKIARELAGAEFTNAAVSMPGGLTMTMEAAVGDDYAVGSWSVLSALRGGSVMLVVARTTAVDPPTYRITEALELGVLCEGLVIEPRTCDLDGTPDPYVFALMDEQYACGGHGESSPARAWSVRSGRLESVDPRRVTCGSVSCEVDPPLRR